MGEAEEGASVAYDVFINHRGPDTKNNIASLIHRRLEGYGLRVFLDKKDLEAGDPLYNTIKCAISSSSVHVAIFSVRYAESSWCLNELLDMLGSGRKVIPILYDVQLEDLRDFEKGRYANAFSDHYCKVRASKVKYDLKLVERWKDALKQATKFSAIIFNTEKDDFGYLVEEIVDKVMKETKLKELHVAEHPVGLYEAAEDFNNFLKERQLCGTTVVGIVGLHGSGKTTLVRFLYNFYLQSEKFKRYCFLPEINNKGDLAALQQQLLRDLLGDGKCNISDTTKGEAKLRYCLKGRGPFLVVLDGLDKEEQIESLLLVVKEVLTDSLILVTCRDRILLAKKHMKLFYHVKLLQGKDAHVLFCRHAFQVPKPPKDLEDLKDLVDDFVKICCGLPLALKDLGQKLSMEQDRRYWEEQLEELQSPENSVDKILKVSYNHLQDTEREVFLDVAHFLVEENKDLAVRVLEGFQELHGKVFTCLIELQKKCLLWEEIDNCKSRFDKEPDIHWRTNSSSKIRMYDLVRKMARRIANQGSCPSQQTKPLRLCQWDDKSILQQLQRGDNHVRGIRREYIDEPERQDPDIKEPQLPRDGKEPQFPNMDKPEMTDEKIYGLRLLVLNDFRVPFPFDCLSGDLIWLRMHKSNWGNTIPSTLSLRNLRVLELDGVKLEALGSMDGDKFPCELTVEYCGESEVTPKRSLPSSSRVDKNSMGASVRNINQISAPHCH